MNKLIDVPEFNDDDSQKKELINEINNEEKKEEIDEEIDNSEDDQVVNQEEEQEQKEEDIPEKIKIGDSEFSQEELNQLVLEGQKVQKWKDKNPGFDVDKLYPEYTRSRQELKKLRETTATLSDYDPKQYENIPDLEEEQVKILEKHLNKLGYVKQGTIVNKSINAIKDTWLSDNPEFLQQNDPNDLKWKELKNNLDQFKWESNPDKLYDYLSKAKKDLLDDPNSIYRRETLKSKEKPQNKLNSIGSQIGKSNSTTIKKQSTLTDNQRRIMLDGGWTEEELNNY